MVRGTNAFTSLDLQQEYGKSAAVPSQDYPLIHICSDLIHRFATFEKNQAMQHLEEIPVKQTLPGFFGKMVHGDSSSLVFWDIKKGSALPEHHHVHEQITYIAEGELEMIIGGEKYLCTAGFVHVIPSHVPHSAYALTDCKVIDSFAPARDDYR
jgi:quercetin dioxygenase-like cupin family protein